MTNCTMEYQGYTTIATYNADGKYYAGTVLDIDDIIAIEGETLDEFHSNFMHLVDSYCKACNEWDMAPNAPPKQTMVPIQTELYAKATSIAKNKNQTANSMINQAIKSLVSQPH